MHTKLTLRLETGLIEQAKQYAAQRGKSVSQMVAEYFGLIGQAKAFVSSAEEPMPPITAKLHGILAGHSVDSSDYGSHLEQRYL